VDDQGDEDERWSELYELHRRLEEVFVQGWGIAGCRGRGDRLRHRGAAPTGGGVCLGRRAELGLTVGRGRAGGTAFGYSMSVWKREAQAAHEQITQWELDRYLQLFSARPGAWFTGRRAWVDRAQLGIQRPASRVVVEQPPAVGDQRADPVDPVRRDRRIAVEPLREREHRGLALEHRSRLIPTARAPVGDELAQLAGEGAADPALPVGLLTAAPAAGDPPRRAVQRVAVAVSPSLDPNPARIVDRLHRGLPVSWVLASQPDSRAAAIRTVGPLTDRPEDTAVSRSDDAVS
jgi:hypothetical protein